MDAVEYLGLACHLFTLIYGFWVVWILWCSSKTLQNISSFHWNDERCCLFSEICW